MQLNGFPASSFAQLYTDPGEQTREKAIYPEVLFLRLLFVSLPLGCRAMRGWLVFYSFFCFVFNLNKTKCYLKKKSLASDGVHAIM